MDNVDKSVNNYYIGFLTVEKMLHICYAQVTNYKMFNFLNSKLVYIILKNFS